LIENLNSGGFHWAEKCLATDGTVPDCKAKSSKGGSVSNFMENLREGGLGCGLTMDFQF